MRRIFDSPAYYLVMMTLTLHLNYLDRSILAILLGSIKQDLGLTDTQIGLLSGFSFVLLYAIAGVPLARLADKHGRHLVISFGLLTWSFATLCSGFVTSALALFLCRAGVGVGEAAGTGPSYALVGDQFPKAKRPLIMGVMNAGGALGTAAGLSLGAIVATHYGWRTAFILAGVPGVVLGVLCIATLRDRRPATFVGEIDVSPSLADTARFILKKRSLMLTFLGSMFLGVNLMVIATWTPVYFIRVFSQPLAEIGLMLGLIKGATGLMGTLAGGAVTAYIARKNDRWQAATPAVACLLSAPAVYVFINAADPTVAFAAIGVTMFCTSLGLGPIFSIYQCVALPRLRSQAVALHGLIASIGMGLGPLAIGYLNDHVFEAAGALAIQSSMAIVILAALAAASCFALAGLFLADDIRQTEEAVGLASAG